MAGPCTLLIDPVNQIYTDAAGEHALPWHETPMVKHRLGPNAVPVSNVLNEQLGKWAYSNRNRLTDAPVCLVEAITPWNATAQGKYTATGATKSNVLTGDIVLLMKQNWPDLDEQQFWHQFGSYGHGHGHAGSAFSIRLTSTAGGNVDLTIPAIENAFDNSRKSWSMFACVFNANAVERVVTFLKNGVEEFPQHPRFDWNTTTLTMEPWEYMQMFAWNYGGGFGGFNAGQPLGIRFKNTLAGERFYVILFSVVADRGFNGVIPPILPTVHTTSSDIPDTYWLDPNALNPITPFAGTGFVSRASTGETFWRCPITTDHIPDDTHYAVASRTHPVFMPAQVDSFRWVLTRPEEIIVTPAASFQHHAQEGLSVDIRFPSSYLFGGTIDDNVPAFDAASAIIEGNFDRQTTADVMLSTVDGTRQRVRAADVAGDWDTCEQITPGWMALYDDERDPAYLLPGAPYVWGNLTLGGTASYIMSREHAIFARDLTDGEYAFLADDTAVWSLNMFATPATATLTGIDAQVYRGDDYQVGIVVKDADGDAVPLHGLTVWFTAKSSPFQTDANADIFCVAEFAVDGTATGTAIADSDAGAGTVAFDIAFESDKSHAYYDVQVRDLNGRIRTVKTGQVVILKESTLGTVAP
jgi:hypothetical protein